MTEGDLDRRFLEALAAGEGSVVLRLVDQLQREGRFAECRERLEAAWQALPSESRIAERLLELYQRYHNWRDWDLLAEAALDLHPRSGELQFTLGCGQEARGALEEARESFAKAAAIAPGETEPILRQARVLRLAHRVEEAIRVLSKALRRHGAIAPLHAALGYAWIQNARPEKAVDCFRRALARQPDWNPYQNDLAGALMLCERWREAAQAAVESLRLRKRNERAWTVYAIANNRLGDAARADQGYRNAVRAARHPSRAKGNYGLFLARHPKRLLEAVRLLGEAYEEHPDWDEVGARLAEITDPEL